MTIRDQVKYLESQVDWAILDGCFPGKIRPSDVDGIVEINSRVLFLEHKLPGATIEAAATLMYRRLARRGDTVIAFRSAAPHKVIDRLWVWCYPEGLWLGRPMDNVRLPEFRAMIEEWADWAKEQDPVWAPGTAFL